MKTIKNLFNHSAAAIARIAVVADHRPGLPELLNIVSRGYLYQRPMLNLALRE